MKTAYSITRRTALGVLAAITGSALVKREARGAPAIYKRKNIDDLSEDELKAYTGAVKILSDRGKVDPDRQDGYAWQARLHNDGDRPRPDGTFGRCEHRSEEFFPWHRAHLVGFERMLRLASPASANVFVPYWDWTKPPSGRRLPKAFEDSSSPLFVVRADDASPVQWSAEDVAGLVKESEWNTFAGKPKLPGPRSSGPLERGPHNFLHPAIGPTMGDPATASEDPIYWSFHAYLDLIWSRWQRLHTNAARPQPFADPNPTLWVEPFTPKVGETATTTALLYEYDYDFEAADGPITTLVASSSSSERAPVDVIAEGQLFRTVQPSKEPSTVRRTFLRIRDVAARPDTTYELIIFVHPRSVEASALSSDASSKYLVERAAIWQAHHEEFSDIYIDISNAIKNLGPSDWAATIQVKPVPTAGAAPEVDERTAMFSKEVKSTRPLFGNVEIEER